MKKIKFNKNLVICLSFFLTIFTSTVFGQEVNMVKRNYEGTSVIRENIDQNKEFNFFRDWSNIAKLKSGIGETVELFPIIFSNTEKKIELHGLQLDVEVKPQTASVEVRNSGSSFNIVNKNFIKRSIFIDKADVARLIAGIQKEVVPELKSTYKKKSKEYVFKCKELFFSFFIYEKKARITMHVADYGPSGDKLNSEQIEFWTESNVDEIPQFLETIKAFYATMK